MARRANQKYWIFEYYYGEYTEEEGYIGSTDSTQEFSIDNLISVTAVKDLIQDESMSVELKVFIPRKIRDGEINEDDHEILHAEIGDSSFCDGTKIPAKIIRDWKKNKIQQEIT